jgi:hypothetical protein
MLTLAAQLINARKVQLQKYLETLMRNRAVARHEAFHLFLMPSLDAPLVDQAAEATPIGAMGGDVSLSV